MNRFRMTYKFILHFLSATNTRGFGVHSPYLFHFTKFVLNNKGTYYIFSSIEKIRSQLKKDQRKLDITDFGTGLKKQNTVGNIAKKSLKTAKYGQLLFRLSVHFKAQNTLELGTSLGLTTAYLAAPSAFIKCISLEGCQEIADIAIENFKALDIKNAQIVVGDIDLTLPKVLNEFNQLDLIFIDANHKSEAVLSYFEQCMAKVHSDSVMVVDDIYWSADMEKAWKVIKTHPRVMATIDLFQLGIVFFNTDLHKKHYKMRF
ncbi:MAG: class I SAM-dependent methyltransferase [Paludibacter sp.]|nr:class I SAM-dependent methyltransferase [Paludibacter sp.]